MCDLCVINAVKNRMLQKGPEEVSARRDFLKRAAVGATVAAGAGALATPSLAQGANTVEDLTHELHPDFPTYFGEPGFSMEQLYNFSDNGFNLFTYNVNEHTGTHIDAPLHFSADGQSVAEIPVENLVVPLCIIDIASRAQSDADAQLTPEDIKAWIASHGDIPDKACVAMHSGWGRYVNDTKFRNADDEGTQHYPGFHVDAVQMLMEETGAVGIAVDTLSLDHGMSPDFATHYAWLPTNRWGIENIANLDKLPASGATLVVGAPKHRGGTGGPCRVFAMV